MLRTGFAPSLVPGDAALTVTLAPLEIRTFACTTDLRVGAGDGSEGIAAPRWVRFLLGHADAGDGAPLVGSA